VTEFGVRVEIDTAIGATIGSDHGMSAFIAKPGILRGVVAAIRAGYRAGLTEAASLFKFGGTTGAFEIIGWQ